jgi:hypothetical protein
MLKVAFVHVLKLTFKRKATPLLGHMEAVEPDRLHSGFQLVSLMLILSCDLHRAVCWNTLYIYTNSSGELKKFTGWLMVLFHI